MLRVTQIQKNYGLMPVLSDVSFSLARGQKVALVGHNGTGKTTLLKVLSGLVEVDAGEIEIEQGACIGYLPQDTSVSGAETITAYLKKVVGIDVLEEKMEVLAQRLNDAVSAAEYGNVQEAYEHLHGYTFDHRMRITLAGFGLEDSFLTRSLSSLSSGQKSKVALVGILLKGVDLLLLDEPTNNLDLPALIWLEDFLQKSEATCIIVSHDRRFLDRVVRKIFEIDWRTRTLNISGGTYSDYLETMAKQTARQKEQHRLQQEEIGRLTEKARDKRADSERGSRWVGSDNDKFLRGFNRNKAGKSSRDAKVLEKRIERMEKVERPVEREPFEIRLNPHTASSDLNIRVSEVSAGYEGGFVVGPISFDAGYGDRVGIMGLNGSGKSTLLKTITGELMPLKGVVEIGSGVKIGNMMQEHETLPRDSTSVEFLMARVGFREQDSYASLAKFGFEEKQMRQAIGVLSPGGRARLLLALFSAESANVLVLDEPTNHLDLEALTALEEALDSYRGTILLVSHDRYFLEKARLNVTYVLSDGMFTKIPDYRTYVAQAEARAQKLLRALD